MDKDAYIKALEKQTTDMGAARFILALAKQNPGLSQLFLTTLGQIHRNASTTTSSKYRTLLKPTENTTAEISDNSQLGQNDNPQTGGNNV